MLHLRKMYEEEGFDVVCNVSPKRSVNDELTASMLAEKVAYAKGKVTESHKTRAKRMHLFSEVFMINDFVSQIVRSAKPDNSVVVLMAETQDDIPKYLRQKVTHVLVTGPHDASLTKFGLTRKAAKSMYKTSDNAFIAYDMVTKTYNFV